MDGLVFEGNGEHVLELDFGKQSEVEWPCADSGSVEADACDVGIDLGVAEFRAGSPSVRGHAVGDLQARGSSQTEERPRSR